MTRFLPGFTKDVVNGQVVYIRTEDPETAIFEAVIRAFRDRLSVARDFRDNILSRLTSQDVNLLYLMLLGRDADEPVAAWQYSHWLVAMNFTGATARGVQQAQYRMRKKLGGWWEWFIRPKVSTNPMTIVRGDSTRTFEVSPNRIQRLERQLDGPDLRGDGHD